MKGDKLHSNLLLNTILSLLIIESACSQPRAQAQSTSTTNEVMLTEKAAGEATRRIGVEQQAFFLEKNRFTLDWNELNKRRNLNLGAENQFYKYALSMLEMPRFMDGVLDGCKVWDCKKRAVLITTISKRNNLKSYIGVVWLGFSQEIPGLNEYQIYQLICASDRRKLPLPLRQPKFVGEGLNLNEVMCPDGFYSIRQ